MKFIFKHLILPILIILAIPATILAFMYSDVSIPTEDYQASGNIDLTSMISDEIDTFLTDPQTTSDLSIGIEQSDANTLIKNSLLTQLNANYLDGSGGDNDYYVIKDTYYGYQGSWVKFSDDTVDIVSGAHVFVGGFTYKTSLLISFKLDVNTEQVTLTLDKINIGHVPFAWIFGVADWAVNLATGSGIEEMINNQLNGLATFDPQTREIVFDVQDLIDQQIGQDNPDSAAMINSLLTFLGQNDLLDIGFNDGSFDASLGLGQLLDETTPFSLSATDQIADGDELTTILQAKATSIAVSVLTTTTTPYIDLDEFTLNRMMDYMMRDSQSTPGVLFTTTLFENYTLTAGMLYVTMDDNFVVNIPLEIVDINDSAKKFTTIIKIDATPTIQNGNDLVIELNSLTAGTVTLDGEHMDAVLGLIGDNPYIVDGNIVLEDFDSQMQQAGMSINDIAVNGSNLRLFVTIDTLDLSGLQTAVTDILDGTLSTDYPDISDEVDTLLTNIANGTGDTEADTQALIDAISELDDETQQALYTDLADDLAAAGYSLDDLLGVTP